MSQLARKIVFVLCATVVAGSLMAFFATGSYAYTRFRDAEIETTNAETDLADLFAETGAETRTLPEVESVNAIGFLPSGTGREAVSVVTFSLPAVIVAAVVWRIGRRRHTAAVATASQTTETS